MAETATYTLDEAAGRRANVYYVLARSLEPPTNWDADLPHQIRAAFSGMPGSLPSLGDRLADQIDDLLDSREPAAIDHAKLFLGPFEILAAPWASHYLEDEPRLMGPTSQYAARAYAEAGLAPSGGMRDAPDHITHELEFMYFLAFRAATTGDVGWEEYEVLFWREHLGQWLPRFADAVTRAGVHDVYGSLATIIQEICTLKG